MFAYTNLFKNEQAMNWYLKVLKQYADFNGRARRLEYWIFALINTVVMCILFGIALALISSDRPSANVLHSGGGYIGTHGVASVMGALVFVILVLYSLAVAIPSIAVAVRPKAVGGILFV
jgi:uncharacterized membrane protein YhaH (DUF805 family)